MEPGSNLGHDLHPTCDPRVWQYLRADNADHRGQGPYSPGRQSRQRRGREDARPRPKLGRAAAAAIPSATLVEFPELGHSPQIGAPASSTQHSWKRLSSGFRTLAGYLGTPIVKVSEEPPELPVAAFPLPEATQQSQHRSVKQASTTATTAPRSRSPAATHARNAPVHCSITPIEDIPVMATWHGISGAAADAKTQRQNYLRSPRATRNRKRWWALL